MAVKIHFTHSRNANHLWWQQFFLSLELFSVKINRETLQACVLLPFTSFQFIYVCWSKPYFYQFYHGLSLEIVQDFFTSINIKKVSCGEMFQRDIPCNSLMSNTGIISKNYQKFWQPETFKIFISLYIEESLSVPCVSVYQRDLQSSKKVDWHTDKKEYQVFLKYREIQSGAVAKSYMTNGLLNPHIWGNIGAFPHILGSPTSCMTLQLLYSEFLYIWGKLDILFYQCNY